MKNAEAEVCRAAGPRWEARWGPGGRRSVTCALKSQQKSNGNPLEICRSLDDPHQEEGNKRTGCG